MRCKVRAYGPYQHFPASFFPPARHGQFLKKKPANLELPNRPVEKLSDSARPGRGRDSKPAGVGRRLGIQDVGRNQAGWDDDWLKKSVVDFSGWGGTTAGKLESRQLAGWDSLAVSGSNITTEN